MEILKQKFMKVVIKMKKILVLFIFMVVILPVFASNVSIQSKKQYYDSSKNQTWFEDDVVVKMDDMTLKSPRAVVDIMPDNKINKATFLDGVYAIKDNKVNQYDIKSDILTASLLNKKIRASGNTISKFYENRVPAVVLTADAQEYDITTNLMRAFGDVKITYKDVVATSNESNLKVDKNNKIDKMKLIGNAVVTEKNNVVKAHTIVYNPKSEEVVAIGNTHSHATNKDGSAFDIYANHQQYDKRTGSMMTSGHVKITYLDYVAHGPKATFLPDSNGKINKIIFYGRSKIDEKDKSVEADKIVMTLNPKNFTAEGNVKTTFKNIENLSTSGFLGDKK